MLAGNIEISRNDWNEAKSSKSGSAMTKFLMSKLFSKEELVQCNYKGGGDNNLKPLDGNRVSAIRGK